MSEAMSSVEIEDVLSSIRRLVSEDFRPAARQAAAPVAAPQPDEKLLLTPAFRVVGDKDFAHVLAAPAPVARPAPLPRLHLGVDPAVGEALATLERAVEAQEIEWESEVGDPLPPVASMEWTEDGWANVEVATEAAAPAFTAEPEVPSWAQTDPDQDTDDHAADLDPAAPIAEPDDIWADRAEAEVVAELNGPDRPATNQTVSAEPLLDELTFDEQVLRDVVRDLIREELQGALGERITRNVRKLVRAEIARAIATQDLE